MRAKQAKPNAHPQLHQWLRVLMATFLICTSLAMGSVVGVLAQTFMPAPEQWVKIPVTDPVTGEAVKDPTTGEIQYTMVKKEAAGAQLINPFDVISPFNNLDRRINILLLGSDYNYVRGKRVNDKEAGVRSRTDTIMLASLDPTTQKVSILSIPRDTRALLPGYHIDKINAAMTYGGVDLVKSTVQELTGVPIDYYMALKVDGLINTVDILGGIRIYVEKDMKYQDDTAHLGINIHKGWKDRMNGEQAHGYIRFRKDELGDIGRVQRQQKFIRAVVDKLLQPESWLKFPALMQHLNENIETDAPQDVIGQFIKFGVGLKRDDLRMVMLPGTFANIGGVSYWQMDSYLARNVITDLFPDSSLARNEDPAQTAGGTESPNPYARYRVTVWNATEDRQVGREVVRRLREAGWNVWATYKAPHGAPTSRFIAQTGKSELLPDLQNAVRFPRGEAITASIGDIASDFTVLICDDLAIYLRNTMKPEDWNRADTAPLPRNPGVSSYWSRRQTPAQPAVAQTTQLRTPVQPAQAIRQPRAAIAQQQPLMQQLRQATQQAAPAQTQAVPAQPAQVVDTAPAQVAPPVDTAPPPPIKPRFRNLQPTTEVRPQLPDSAGGGAAPPADPIN